MMQNEQLSEIKGTWAGYTALDAFGERNLVGVFHRLGVLTQAGEITTFDALKKNAGVISKFSRQVDALLRILQGSGWISIENDQIRVLRGQTQSEADLLAVIDNEQNRLVKEHPSVAIHMLLMGLFLRNYPDFLRGSKFATDILFPNGDMSRALEFYRGNAISNHFNSMLAKAVSLYVEGIKSHLWPCS